MSTLRVDTIQNAAGTTSPINVPGTAKAWVNFNGTGTVAIRASYNVSSITDNGTGYYTVNFTTAMADADYAVVNSSSRNSGNVLDPLSWSSVHNLTTSGFDMIVTQTNSSFSAAASLSDLGAVIGVAIFR